MSERSKDFSLFLEGKSCLILEPSQTFAFALQIALQQLGIESSQIFVTRKFQDAKKFVLENKPKIIVTEYEVDTFFGMDLIEIQSKQYEQAHRISFITTQNSSDSAVAEASEGEVDGYLLKPFAMSVFQEKFEAILSHKLHPSEYLLKITAGKALYTNKDYSSALQEFIGAKTLNEKPTLACYHTGRTFQKLGEMEKALAEFQAGRKYQPLHYKCLIGEFEALVALKNYPEAYELVEPIRKNYPITSKRLGHMFVAAVFTGHFDDLPGFYKLFGRLDQKTPELINISSMALLTAGRSFVKQKNFDKAFEYFEMGFMITGRRFDFLEKIVGEFTKAKAVKEAEALLAKANSTDIGTPAYLQMEFRLDQLILTKDKMIEKGRKLIFAGHGDLEIFKTVVQAMAELGKETLAESVITKVAETEPKLRPVLYEILSKYLVKKDKN